MRIINTISIDVEEYFHVHRFSDIVREETWNNYSCRNEFQISLLLDLFEEFKIKSTFFILGWVAKKNPSLIKLIYQHGHEIATHGFSHKLIFEQTRNEFKFDLKISIEILEQIIGNRILGYRAPSFSINSQTLWAFDTLKELGIKYDSSIMPSNNFWHNRYGDLKGHCYPYEIVDGIWEFPISVLDRWYVRVPIGGGAWIRHLPFSFIIWGLKKISTRKNPLILYFHPWEFDEKQPRIKSSRISQYIHYKNLNKTQNRLREICQTFKFSTIKSIWEEYQHEDSHNHTK